MGTPAIIEFRDYENSNEPIATVYRHFDGYPDGAGIELLKFFQKCLTFNDTRLDDPMYLAARWVFYDANKHPTIFPEDHKNPDASLGFIGIGIIKNADDVSYDYRYSVVCNRNYNKFAHLKHDGYLAKDIRREPKVMVYSSSDDFIGVLDRLVSLDDSKSWESKNLADYEGTGVTPSIQRNT